MGVSYVYEKLQLFPWKWTVTTAYIYWANQWKYFAFCLCKWSKQSSAICQKLVLKISKIIILYYNIPIFLNKAEVFHYLLWKRYEKCNILNGLERVFSIYLPGWQRLTVFKKCAILTSVQQHYTSELYLKINPFFFHYSIMIRWTMWTTKVFFMFQAGYEW